MRMALFSLCIFIAAMSFAGEPKTPEASNKSRCVACHGPDGSGKMPMGLKLGARDLGSPEVQKLSDDELLKLVSNGRNKMPPFKDALEPDQIKALVSYIRKFAHK